MNKLYAQLDVDGNVHTICSLAGEIIDDKLIKIDSMDKKLLQSKYDKVKKEYTKIKDGKTFKYNKNLPDFQEVAK